MITVKQNVTLLPVGNEAVDVKLGASKGVPIVEPQWHCVFSRVGLQHMFSSGAKKDVLNSSANAIGMLLTWILLL